MARVRSKRRGPSRFRTVKSETATSWSLAKPVPVSLRGIAKLLVSEEELDSAILEAKNSVLRHGTE